MMEKIALIYMGGTFGCIGEPLSPMPAAHFLPLLQRALPLHLDIECFVAPVIKDSSACTATDWLKLLHMLQRLQREHYQYFVILHGTDTLSYASAVLARFMGQSAHIVLTGSQYPLLNLAGTHTREFTDATDNLNFALNTVLQTPTGVYLAFHHKLLHAQTALKQHTTELDAFAGLNFETPLALAQHPYLVNEQDIEKAKTFNCLSWMLQPLDFGQHLSNLKTLLHHPPAFLILQGFGVGNIATNPELLNTLQQLQQNNCLLILSTQVPFGVMHQHYAINQWIKDSQIIRSDALGHADLYAKALQMYLQYNNAEERHKHWYDEHI
jgi:L-asparaginase